FTDGAQNTYLNNVVGRFGTTSFTNNANIKFVNCHFLTTTITTSTTISFNNCQFDALITDDGSSPLIDFTGCRFVTIIIVAVNSNYWKFTGCYVGTTAGAGSSIFANVALGATQRPLVSGTYTEVAPVNVNAGSAGSSLF
ncbi:hypothetical protein KDA11_01060, partial [Candidatus Saccharibacteria bacterium]|nr:hypothetical protein [Candidatus Saccharibacteria bacterium]